MSARTRLGALRGARLSRRTARSVLIGVVVADVVALALFSVRLEETTKVTSTRPGAPATAPALAGAAAPATQPIAVPAALPVVVPGSVGAASTTVVPPQQPAAPGGDSGSDESPAPTPAPAQGDGPGEETPAPDAAAVSIQPCPIDLTEGGPEKNAGGLQSLIPFAPAFGPFSAEAFAAAAAYQPALQLIGPLLSQYPSLEPAIGPALAPLLSAFGQGGDLLFGILGPLYAPYRTQVLEAEAQLAAALAPITRQIAGSALGGCAIELQNALLAGASGVAPAAR